MKMFLKYLKMKKNKYYSELSINFHYDDKAIISFYHTARNLFAQGNKTNTFVNDGNLIMVTNQDIKECVSKIINDRIQNQYLIEHLMIFKNLGNIIEKGRLVNQTYENKNRHKYVTWNYYYSGINIARVLYDLEFDVVSRIDGQNHYRVHRIKKADIQSTLPN